MTNLKRLQNEFYDLGAIEQSDILMEYADYVAGYPDEHDEGSYPACFWEWYDNDWKEVHEK